MERIENIKQTLNDPPDLVIHFIKNNSLSLAVIYFKSLTESISIQKNVIENLQQAEISTTPLTNYFMSIIATPCSLKETDEDLIEELLNGNGVVLIEGESSFISCTTYSKPGRDIVPSETEINIRGPHEAFTERIEKNLSLLRIRIRHPNLCFKTVMVGKDIKTKIVIAYMENLAPKEVVDEVLQRLNKIDVNFVLESQHIEENIEDTTFSMFPTINNTERADVVTSKIMEGRVAIFTDGSPFVLTVPTLCVEFFQTAEDYYHRWDISTLLRLLRFSAFLWGLLVPGLYVALTTYHHEMIPTQLLISLAAQREGVPYPSFVEVILMEAVFEVLREAGLRMPVAIGSAISIVGALILGQAAVQAGLISASVVIVVSLTAIANFVTPSYSFGITGRILRFLFLLLAGFLGFYGIFFGVLMILVHAASLQSFGVSYLSPFSPINLRDIRDSFIKLPDKWVKNKLPKGIERRREGR